MSTFLIGFCVIILLAHICLAFVEKYTMLGKVVNGMTVVCMMMVIVYALTAFDCNSVVKPTR